MAGPHRIAAVILHYGKPALALRLAETLRQDKAEVAQRVRIFDNAAPLPCPGAWRRAEHNLYWAGALSEVLRLVREEGYTHLWFLNNDVRFTGPAPYLSRVEARLAAVEQRLGPVGIWTPAVGDNPYHPQMCRLPSGGLTHAAVVDGIAPLYALDCLEAIGGVDAGDNPYGYGVDLWISLRASQAGWPVLVDHDLLMEHRYHSTAKTLPGFMTQAAAAEKAYLHRRLHHWGPDWAAQLEALKTPGEPFFLSGTLSKIRTG